MSSHGFFGKRLYCWDDLREIEDNDEYIIYCKREYDYIKREFDSTLSASEYVAMQLKSYENIG